MRAFTKLAFVQTKLYLRDPMSVFFTLLFGPLLLIMFGFIFGNEPQAILGGLGHLDISVPSYTAVIIGITGLTTLPIATAIRREQGVLRRFAASPIRPLTYFLADMLAPLLVTTVGISLLFVLGITVYHVRFEGSWLNIILAVCLSTLTLFLFGYVLVGLLPTARAVMIVGNVLIIPMNVLSGALIPIEVMPDAVRRVSDIFPLTHAVTLLRGLWFAESWSTHLNEVAILLGVMVVSVVIIVRTFRWE